MRLTAILATTLAALLLVLSCNTVDSRQLSAVHKRHTVQKRATVEDVLGNLTAEEPGILNEKGKYTQIKKFNWFCLGEKLKRHMVSYVESCILNYGSVQSREIKIYL